MSLLNKIASLGISEVLKGAGEFAKDIRSAITGEVSPEAKAKLEQTLMQLELALEQLRVKIVEFQSLVIIAEAQGNWIQRSWRPILMLSIVTIVVNNYLVYPYLALFGVPCIVLELPEKLWSLMEIGVGGYILGRSGEKIVDRLKQ